MGIESLFEDRNRRMDSLIAAFQAHLKEAVTRAQGRTVGQLAARLALDADGAVKPTPANAKILRSVDALFLKNLTAAGYERVISGFVGEFHGALPMFEEVLAALSEDIGRQLTVEFSSADKKFFVSQQLSDIDSIKDEIGRAAVAAKRDALFSIGGLPFEQLSETLAVKFGLAVSHAESVAATALPTFYRTVSDRGFQKIEAELEPGKVIRYTYYGPLDKFNRPVCRRWMTEARTGKTWTRAQIAELDNGNGQPKPVMICCGGWRCRHQWLVKGIG